MTSITVLGPVAVGDAGPELAPRDRVVLAVLVAHRDREVPAETIAQALWGEDLPPSWPKVVQGCIARLRRRLGAEAIVTGRSSYRLVVPADEVDAGRFEQFIQRAREFLAIGHADQAAYAAGEALALWRGRALGELEDWEPGRGEAQRLTELRLLAEELLLDALLAAGRHEGALTEAAVRVREEPLREHRWALLARAQYQDGQQAEALATLRRARQVLAEELGLDPGPELVELEQAVLRQDPHLAVPAAGTPSATCPWPGLAAYDVEEADSFFGRDAEIAECVERLGRAGFLAVVGPSGSGKSSLVRAGLAARLRSQGRRVQVITPDPQPLDALAAAARRSRSAVLVVDQGEMAFAPSVPDRLRREFATALVEQAVQGPVVLTLRSDRLGEVSAYPALAGLIESGLYLLKGMGEEGLREAIERPARQAGLLLEQGLVDLLVRDVEGEPGSLPLLAHALRQTWERREGANLTVAGYRASGGIRGAVAQSAEQVYEAATPEQRLALRELLLRMVQLGPQGEPVPTSVPRDFLDTDAEHAALLEQLVRARLITANQDRWEIAHEALARAWPRLQGWLSDDVEGERIRHHLAATAEAWRSMGQPDSELYRGARLAKAQEWHTEGGHRLGILEEEFLQASLAAHRSELARAEAEAARQRQVNRRLRLLIVGACVLALVATAFGGAALLQWQRSERAEASAETQAAQARSHELSAAAVAALDSNPPLAKALAIAGAEAAPPTFQSVSALHRAHAADRVVSRVSINHFVSRLWAVLHPDGTRVAMTGETVHQPALAVEVHDARSGDLLWEWVRPDQPGYESAFVAGAAYSADGAVLATGVVWNPTEPMRVGPAVEDAPPPAADLVGIHLWDGETHEPVDVLDVGPCGGWPLEVGGSHVLLRTLVADPAVGRETAERVVSECSWGEGLPADVLVDRATGAQRVLGVGDWGSAWSFGAALSEDGAVAAVWDREANETVLVDTRTGEEERRLDGAIPYDLDATGERVLIQHGEGLTPVYRVVGVDDGSTLSEFRGHEANSIYAAFAPGGRSVLSTSLDNVLIQWDADTGEVIHRVPAVASGRPSGTESHLALVPRSVTYGAVLVDTEAGGEGWSVPSCGGDAYADVLRVGRDRIVVGRDCGPAQFGQLETLDQSGGNSQALPDAAWSQGMEISPEGDAVVSQSGRNPSTEPDPDWRTGLLGALEVRDLSTGEVTLSLEGFCEYSPLDEELGGCSRLPEIPFAFMAWRVRWSPDGRWIAAVDEAVAVWDARTGELVATTGGDGSPEQGRWGGVQDVLFTSDSRQLVLTTGAGQLVAVDTSTWEVGTERDLGIQTSGSTGLVGQAADGSLVAVSPYRQNAPVTTLLLVDPATLTPVRTVPDVAEDSVRAGAVSPDGTRVALAASDGSVAVWDLTSGGLLDQANPGLGSLQGVQWLDDHDVLLMSARGHLITLTTDAQKLLRMVRESVTRGMTETECGAYGFEACPDLAHLRGEPVSVPEELQGRSFALTWTAHDLTETLVAHYRTAFRATLDEASVNELAALAEEWAGEYELEFGESSYTITRGPQREVFCSGAVSQRAAGLLLHAESGSWCLDFHYAETGWQLEGDRLHLEGFRGPDDLLWTLKPLTRID